MVLSSLFHPEDSITLALIIGSCSWFVLARLVRVQVRQLRQAMFWQASAVMGTGLWLKLRLHLLPALFSAQGFVLPAYIAQAFTAEATLSFLGLGLPSEELSWGSLLALSGRAMLTNSWWVIVFPGLLFLSVLIAVSLLCFKLQQRVRRRCSNL